MMGLPEATWKGPLTEEILPSIVGKLCPDIPYVPNSPCDGALPLSAMKASAIIMVSAPIAVLWKMRGVRRYVLRPNVWPSPTCPKRAR